MFSDITNHWASEGVVALAQRQIINGYPNGTFRPEARMSRAEFASVMPRVFSQLPERQTKATFSEVFESYWASDAIAWVSQRGLFGGYP
ncbi:MAG: S-layer homology domain-containing protein, partial [Cyanobacteria bacterium J06649_5]